jgi:hypothetical protein
MAAERLERDGTSWGAEEPRWPAALSLCATAAVLWFVAGLPGLAGAVLLAAAWIALPGIAVYALGQVVVGAAVPAGAARGFLLAETALAGLLLVPAVATGAGAATGIGTPPRDVAVTVIAWLGLAAVGWGAYTATGTAWLAALALALAGIGLSYLGHRYVLFRLDLIDRRGDADE